MKQGIFITFLAVFLTACSGYGDLADAELIRAVGVGGGQSVTVCAASKEEVYTVAAGGFAAGLEALRRLPLCGEAEFTHAEVIVAEADAPLDEILDFVKRSKDFRLKTEVFILEEGDISQIFDAADDVSRELGIMAHESGYLKFGGGFTAHEAAIGLERRGAALLTLVRPADGTLATSGLCAVGLSAGPIPLGEAASAGAALIMNRVKSRVVELGRCTLLLTGLRARLRDGVLSLEGEAELISALPGYDGGREAAWEAERLLRGELTAALEAEARLKADVLDLAGMALSDSVPVVRRTEVTLRLRRSGDMTAAPVFGGGVYG